MPAKAHPTAAIMKEKTTAGPALSCAALGVRAKRPAPMMAPMPRAIRFTGPSVRLSWCAPPSLSRMMRAIGLIAKRLKRQYPYSFSVFILSIHRGATPEEVNRHSQQYQNQPPDGEGAPIR